MRRILAAVTLAAAPLSADALPGLGTDAELALVDAGGRAAILERLPEAGPFLGDVPPSGAAEDGGGFMPQYQVRIAYLLHAQTAFVVPRDCWSACTLYLALAQDPETCFPADGTLHFHAPFDPRNGELSPSAMALFLMHVAVADQGLAARLAVEIPALKPGEWIDVPMASLIEKGALRPC